MENKLLLLLKVLGVLSEVLEFQCLDVKPADILFSGQLQMVQTDPPGVLGCPGVLEKVPGYCEEVSWVELLKGFKGSSESFSRS